MIILYVIVLFLGVLGLVGGLLMFWSVKGLESSEENGVFPLVSIIIPARNEAKRLPVLLKSLQKQVYDHYEVIVIDDDSEDGTSSIAKGFGARVFQNEEVKAMTSGKSVACNLGAKHVRGEWLLFLDADVKLVNKHSLKKILSKFKTQDSKGILSIQPYHQIIKPYENFSAIFNIIVYTGINAFTIWGDKIKTAGSFGACILCDKESYVLTGGHENAKEAIMDDYALSAGFFRHDLPVENYNGRGVITLRMYPDGLSNLLEGWTKNLATASQSTHRLVMFCVSLWISGAFIATTLLFVPLFTNNMFVIVGSLFFYIVYGLHVWWLARRAGNFSSWLILFYPLLFITFTGVFIYSLYRTHVVRSVTWKGRTIKV